MSSASGLAPNGARGNGAIGRPGREARASRLQALTSAAGLSLSVAPGPVDAVLDILPPQASPAYTRAAVTALREFGRAAPPFR